MTGNLQSASPPLATFRPMPDIAAIAPSFAELPPDTSNVRRSRMPISLAITKRKGPRNPLLSLQIRYGYKQLAPFIAGACVVVAFSRTVGLLRVQLAAPGVFRGFMLAAPGGEKCAKGVVVLRLPSRVIEDLPDAGMSRSPVDWRMTPSGLVVALPAWPGAPWAAAAATPRSMAA